jgi:predicted pyridoxine 5'-phosphate oxidase superfamily flavin-nucleotide-binding protein
MPILSDASRDGVFHEGEEAVQRRAGVFEMAAKLGERMVERSLDAQFAAFLAAQPFVVVGSSAPSGMVWASVLMGPPGFAAATSADRVVIRTAVDDDDPLSQSLADGPSPIGVLVLEPMTRGRIRLNGVGRRTAAGVELKLREVFGNCPKYIQRRRPRELAGPADEGGSRLGTALDPGQRALVGTADTFFVASRHPGRGADASHRGGRPGFVAVADDGASLTFPDYQGNNMFQTLGNLTADPAIGLLFIDWESGRTLQLSGRAEIIWDAARLADWPDAQRLVDVRVEAVIDCAAGSPLVWELVEPHRLNPPVPSTGPDLNSTQASVA